MSTQTRTGVPTPTSVLRHSSGAALEAYLRTIAGPAPGSRLLEVRFALRHRDMGRVFVGQNVGVHADAFPERSFAGRVQTIATRAEFTPRNVQTQKDRQNLVFAVTVRVPNPDGALKAGLPVDATFDS